MKKKFSIFTCAILFLLIQSVRSYSQLKLNQADDYKDIYKSIFSDLKEDRFTYLGLNKFSADRFNLNRTIISNSADKNENASSTLPIALGVASFLYLLNPIILLENDKIGGGITKEISLGFGYFGQHRFSTEYSYIFRQDLSSNLRFAYKYDILLNSGIRPSNFLQGTPVISIGAGYFTNFTNHGYFPELSYGYSIRNDKLLFFPSIKVRYTYVENGANIFDISAGLVIGFANPFIDLHIRADDR